MSLIIKPNPITPPDVKEPHIVSRFLLNQFADKSKHFFKHRKGLPPKWCSTKSECTESGYFGPTHNPETQQTEAFLAGIENYAAMAVRKLSQRNVVLTVHETTFVALFLATQFHRSRKIRERIVSSEARVYFEPAMTDEAIADRQHELLKQGRLITREQIRAELEKAIDIFVNDPSQLQFRNFEQRAIDLAVSIGNKPWSIIRAEEPVFFTSDAPVFSFRMDLDKPALLGGPLLLAQTAIFLAISPRALLIAGPEKASWNPVATPELIADVTRATISAADRAVYSPTKMSGLQATVDAHLGTFRYRAPPPNKAQSL